MALNRNNLQKGEILSIIFYSGIPSNPGVVIKYNSIEYLYLIEDIYSFSITGKIRFTARSEMIDLVHITGNEQLIISYGNAEDESKIRTIVMNIYKMDKVQPLKNTKTVDSITMEAILVDEYFKLWNFNMWSKAWSNQNIGDIVKDISKNFLSIDDNQFNKFERPTEKIEHFDTHLRTPSECIQWLMNRSSSSVNKSAGYLFYRTNNGNSDGYKFNFVTLESLLSSNKYMGPKQDNYIYGFEQANTRYGNKIKTHRLSKVDYNALRTLVGGTILGYDVQRKKLIEKTYSYKDAVKRYTILGTKTLFPAKMESIAVKRTLDGSYNEKMLDNVWYGNWIREYCNQQLLEITVAGHEERYAGGMIKIEWPTENKDKVMNTQMKGKYLVKSITNFFGPMVEGGWVQKMVLIKNGYENSPNTNLLKATKVNM